MPTTNTNGYIRSIEDMDHSLKYSSGIRINPSVTSSTSSNVDISASPTLTVNQLLQGYMNTTTGIGTATTPTATAIVAGVSGAAVGTTFSLLISNTAGANCTLAAGAGVTLRGTLVIPTGTCATVTFIITGVSTPAVIGVVVLSA